MVLRRPRGLLLAVKMRLSQPITAGKVFAFLLHDTCVYRLLWVSRDKPRAERTPAEVLLIWERYLAGLFIYTRIRHVWIL